MDKSVPDVNYQVFMSSSIKCLLSVNFAQVTIPELRVYEEPKQKNGFCYPDWSICLHKAYLITKEK